MKFKARDIAQIIGGMVVGNPEIEVHKLAKIEEGEAGAISFLANQKYTSYIYTTKSSIVIVSSDFEPEETLSCTLIKVDDPYGAFASLLEQYNNLSQNHIGISSLAFIHPDASIGEEVYIGEFAWIGAGAVIGKKVKIHPQSYIGENVTIDEASSIYPGVRIYADCVIGKNCTIHSGAVIGADGFGFAPQSDHNYRKVAQIGNVILEDNVDIGANTTIDRATLGSTIIRQGVKLDNLIQIAHNVEIGKNTVIAAQSGIAGSSKIGSNCMFAGQVGISGHLVIANEVKIAAQSGISGNITKEGAIVMGSPAFDHSTYRKSFIHFRKLTEHIGRINELENRLRTLESRLDETDTSS